MNLQYTLAAAGAFLAVLYVAGLAVGRGKAAYQEQERRRRQARSALWFVLLCLSALIAGVTIR